MAKDINIELEEVQFEEIKVEKNDVKEVKAPVVEKAKKLEVPKAKADSYKFVKIVRKGPSFHTILLEDGSKVSIHKSKVDLKNKTIKA